MVVGSLRRCVYVYIVIYIYVFICVLRRKTEPQTHENRKTDILYRYRAACLKSAFFSVSRCGSLQMSGTLADLAPLFRADLVALVFVWHKVKSELAADRRQKAAYIVKCQMLLVKVIR